MKDLTKSQIEKLITAATGKSKDEQFDILYKELGAASAVEKFRKDHGLTAVGGAKAGGFTDCIAFLQEKPRSQKELYQWVIDHGTRNEARWIGQRESIRKLAVAIFAQGGYEVQNAPATAAQKEKVKAIVAG